METEMQFLRWLAFARASGTFVFLFVVPRTGVLFGAACSSSDRGKNSGNDTPGGTGSTTGGSDGGASSTIKVTAAPTSVLADGKNTVAISITGAQGSITLTTDRGTFQDSGGQAAAL